MRRHALVSCLATVALAAGCATHWDVDQFTSPEASFAGKQTFFWRGGEIGTPAPIDAAARNAADAQMRATVVSVLEHRGFRQVMDAHSAQLLVGYQISGQRRFELADDRRIGAPLPATVLSPSAVQPPPASETPREVQIRDASVMVFVDDAATGKLAWRGLVNAELRIGSNQQALRVLDDMARHIIEAFPGTAAAP